MDLKKKLGRIFSLLLSGCLLAALVSCGGGNESSSQPGKSGSSSGGVSGEEHLGLYLEDGKMKYDGKEFYGLGVNYYSLFNYTFSHQWDTTVPCKALETLASYGVKAIRFSCEPPGTLGAAKWDWYYQRPERYYATLDTLVEKAEEVGIGLIVEFFGDLYSISDYYDEPLASAVLDENSKSSQFRRDYVREVVTRYKESPAIYGWEFGNELAWNTLRPSGYVPVPALPANSKRPSRTEEDILGLKEINLLYSRFAKAVKECDPYNRIVGNGDQSLQTSAYNASYNDTFATDTLAEHREILAKINPEGMDAVCMHRYADGVNLPQAPDKLDLMPSSKPVELLGADGEPFVLYDTWKDYLQYMLDESARLGKTCYVGEAGWSYQDAKEKQTYESALTVVEAIAKAALETEYPLILFWNYDPLSMPNEKDYVDKGSGIEYSWNENWDKGKAYLETIKKYNAKFDQLIAAGKG